MPVPPATYSHKSPSFVERTKGGIRKFKEKDFEWLSIIECLKNTGMSIKDIKIFIDWCMEGDSTIQERYNMFLERKIETEKQIKVLQESLEKISYKCWYYKTAMDASTTKIHDNVSENNENTCPYSQELLSEISDAE